MAERHDSSAVDAWLKRVHLNCLDDGGCLVWQGFCGPSNVPSGRNYLNVNGSLRRHVYIAFGKQLRGNYSVVMKCGNSKCLNPDHMNMRLRRDILKENCENINPVAAEKRAKINRERNGVLGYDRAEYVRNSDELGIVLAERFGVSTTAINRARNGHTWIKKEGNPFAGLMK